MLLTSIIAKPSAAHGLGLFATEAVPAGTIVWHPCSRCPVFSGPSLSALGPSQFRQLDEYGYYLEDGSIILPCTLAFLLNHSCEANVLDYGLDFGITVRDIDPGDEITCDYRTFASDPGWSVECRCGSRRCAGQISPANALPERLVHEWTAGIEHALELVRRVPQPLHASLISSSRAYSESDKAGFRLDPRQFNIRKQPVRLVEVI